MFVVAQGIMKAYGGKAVLQDISFGQEKGQLLCLLGPNGSGKTTLLDILALAVRPDAGQLRLAGLDALANPTPARRLIGYVPQDIALFSELSVEENLLSWSRQRGRAAKQAVATMMQELNLTALRRKKVRELSGGMKRRVNLAVALLDNPAFLVLDEPLAGVDMENEANILHILEQCKAQGVTIIISDHRADRLLSLMDTALVLCEGSCVFYGSRDELLQHGADVNDALRQILAV